MKNVLFLFLITSFIANSQVGIGTTSPTADLDVDGTFRVRNLPSNSTNSEFLTTDIDGNVYKTNNFVFAETEAIVASSNVDQDVFLNTIINNLNLGLSLTVNIPANKEGFVIISYSVPVGISSFTNVQDSYYGIRFLVDGVEDQAGSRKSSVLQNAASNMTSISCIYTKTYPAQTTDQSITITLNGYIEQTIDGFATYRFNMWTPFGDNFNWGRATMVKQIFLK